MPKKNKSRACGARPTFSQLLATARSEDDPDKLVCDISRLLAVPDVRTARGLKECHYGFNTVSSKLDELYMKTRDDQWDRGSADRLAAFIILIYGCIAEDQVLRGRIFNETQFLERAIALFTSPYSFVGEVVIKTLSEIARHTDFAILRKIMRVIPTILDYVEANRAQLRVDCMDGVVHILVYSTLPVHGNPNPDPELAALAPIARILEFSLANSTEKARDYLSFFCSITASRHSTIFLAKPDSIDFLVAATRAQNLLTRCFAQFSLVKIYSETAWREFKPGRSRQQLHESTSLYAQALQGTGELLTIVQNFDKNSSNSHCQIGYTLSDFIQGCPAMVRTFLAVGNLSAILESCEAALRRDGSSRAIMAADTLHFELLLSRNQATACAFARSCIKHHPSVAYFYYAMSAFPDTIPPPASTIYFAEKGLRCRPISDFIRREFLCLVAIFSHETVAGMLHGGARLDVEHMRKIFILVQRGSLHANTFLDISPLHHPRAAEMSAISTLFNLMLKGDILTPRELETMQAKFSSACKFARDGNAFRLTKEWSALELIFDRMPAAWGRWGSTMSCTEPAEPPSRDPGTSFELLVSAGDPDGDQFLSWLEKLDKSTPEEIQCELRGADDPYLSRQCGVAIVYHCSACHSPNAALKRCSGCQRARYCNC